MQGDSNTAELRAGVVGFGKMGILHAGVLNSLDGVRLCGVADSQPLILKSLKEMLPAHIKPYSDYRQMISGEALDLVYINYSNGDAQRYG